MTTAAARGKSRSAIAPPAAYLVDVLVGGRNNRLVANGPHPVGRTWSR